MAWDDLAPTDTVDAPPTNEGDAPTTKVAVLEPDEAAAASGEAVAEAQGFDLSTEEGVLAAAASADALRKVLDKRQNDGFQAGKLNRDAELRRDQAATSRVEEFARLSLERFGVEVTPEDQNLLRTLTAANEGSARIGMARGYVNATLNYLGESAMPAELETALASLEATGDVKAIEGIASTAVQRVAEHAKQGALASLTEDDLGKLPADHPVNRYIQQRIADGTTEELKAQALEQATTTRTNAPRVATKGPGSGGMTAETARAMSPAEAANLPDSEYAEWKRLFFAATNAA